MPAPRNRCCAITPAGSQCTRHTATDETLGRCKQHHTNSRLDQPATLAVREFEFFLYNHAEDWNARIGLHFPIPAIEMIGARQIKETVSGGKLLIKPDDIARIDELLRLRG